MSQSMNPSSPTEASSSSNCSSPAAAAAPRPASSRHRPRPRVERNDTASAGPMAEQFDVVVIGAGVAGLAAAHKLQTKHHLNVMVLEASGLVGGRVRVLSDEWGTLSLGAEIIHGSKSVMTDFFRERGWQMEEHFIWAQGDAGPSVQPINGKTALYWLGQEGQFLSWDDKRKDFVHVNSLLHGLSNLKVTADDRRSLMQYLVDEGVSRQMLSMAEAGYANTLCSTLDALPLYEASKLEHACYEEKDIGGEHNDQQRDVSLVGTFQRMVDYYMETVRVRTNWVVSKIDYPNENETGRLCRLTSRTGAVVLANRILCTVPITCLQDGDISFSPPLPREKVSLFHRVHMRGAVKVFVEFGRRFWPKDVAGTICSDSFVPEFWFKERQLTERALQNLKPGTKPPRRYLATAFFCADMAESVARMSRDDLVRAVLTQLDRMFGTECDRSPASKSYTRHWLVDWAKEPFIRGGYSAPSAGMRESTRRQMAAAVNGRVFFAGEAMHPTDCMTLHVAMETGLTTADDIASSLHLSSNSNNHSNSNQHSNHHSPLVSRL